MGVIKADIFPVSPFLKKEHFKLFMAIFLIFSLISAACFLFSAWTNDLNGIQNLETISPIVQKLIESGDGILSRLTAVYLLLFSASAALVILVSLLSRREGTTSRHASVLTLPLFSALCAHGLLVTGFVTGGVIMYLLCGIFLLAKRYSHSVSENIFTFPATRFSGKEAVFLTLFWLTVCCVRTYAINRVPAGWDDELCFHKLSSFSIPAVVRHHLGLEGARTSEGLLWTFIQHFWTLVFSSAPLMDRFIAATIGLLLVQVSYFSFRYFFGPLAAFFGMILCTFAPLELGWSRLPCFHHLPELFSILLLLFSVRAVRLKKTQDFLVLMVLMWLSNFLYPSGAFIFLIPVLTLLHSLFFDFQAWKGHTMKFLPVLAGGLGWLFTNSLLALIVTGRLTFVAPVVHHLPNTLDNFNPKQSLLEGLLKSFEMLARNTLLAMHDMFITVTSESHWSPVAAFPPKAVLSAPVAVLFVVGFFLSVRLLKKTEFFCLLSGLVLALLPGLASDFSERRVGGVFPVTVIIGLAAFQYYRNVCWKGDSRFFKVAASSFAVLTACWLMFSQVAVFFRHKGAPPLSDMLAEAVMQRYVDSTLVVPLFHGSAQCMLASSMMDETMEKKGSLGFGYTFERTSLENFLSGEFPENIWIYKNTKLSGLVPEWRKMKQWKRVLVLTRTGAKDAGSWKNSLSKSYSSLRTETVILGKNPDNSFDFTVAE